MPYKLLLICFTLCCCTPNRMIETDLYFGQAKPGGGLITDKEWSDFKENQIVRVFKEGSTVINGIGNWYDPASKKIITEPTYVLVGIYKKSAKLSRQIDSLRYWYKTMFLQQSVLRIDKRIKAGF